MQSIGIMLHLPVQFFKDYAQCPCAGEIPVLWLWGMDADDGVQCCDGMKKATSFIAALDVFTTGLLLCSYVLHGALPLLLFSPPLKLASMVMRDFLFQVD